MANDYQEQIPHKTYHREGGQNPGDSHFWSGLMKVKPKFLMFRSVQLNNGKQIRFREDQWLRAHSFKQQYPSRYNIVRKKSDTIEKVVSRVPLNVPFRRYLIGNKLVIWHNLVQRIMAVRLNNDEDVFRWKLHQHRKYYVHYLYLALINSGLVERNKTL
jgi:hypothetical protein